MRSTFGRVKLGFTRLSLMEDAGWKPTVRSGAIRASNVRQRKCAHTLVRRAHQANGEKAREAVGEATCGAVGEGVDVVERVYDEQETRQQIAVAQALAQP